MPKDNSRKRVLLQVTGDDPDVIEAVRQFKKFAVDHENYGKALQRLMEMVGAKTPAKP